MPDRECRHAPETGETEGVEDNVAGKLETAPRNPADRTSARRRDESPLADARSNTGRPFPTSSIVTDLSELIPLACPEPFGGGKTMEFFRKSVSFFPA